MLSPVLEVACTTANPLSTVSNATVNLSLALIGCGVGPVPVAGQAAGQWLGWGAAHQSGRDGCQPRPAHLSRVSKVHISNVPASGAFQRGEDGGAVPDPVTVAGEAGLARLRGVEGEQLALPRQLGRLPADRLQQSCPPCRPPHPEVSRAGAGVGESDLISFSPQPPHFLVVRHFSAAAALESQEQVGFK